MKKFKVGNKYQILVSKTAQKTLLKWSFSCARIWNWCLDIAFDLEERKPGIPKDQQTETDKLWIERDRNYWRKREGRWCIGYMGVTFKSPFIGEDGMQIETKVTRTDKNGKESTKSEKLYDTLMDELGSGFNGMLTVFRRNNPEFAETPNCCQQETLRDLDKALRRFKFDKNVIKTRAALRAKAKTPKDRAKAETYAKPRFKSAYRDFPGLYFPKERFDIVRRDGRVYLSLSKLKSDFRIVTDDREIPESLNGAVVSFDPLKSQWFVALKFDQEFDNTRAAGFPEVATDMGITSTVMLSDGTEYNVPKQEMFKLNERKERLQRVLSRKVGSEKGARKSKNFLKVKHKIALIDRRISDIRQNFDHQTSSTVAASHSTVYKEDLDIVRMTKSRRGTVDAPGCGVQAKANLNRHILGGGWGNFSQFLEYKIERRGGSVVEVRAEYSSQTCSSCWANPLDDPGSTSRDGKDFSCRRCGLKMDADVNAAKVILARGKGNNKAFPRATPPEPKETNVPCVNVPCTISTGDMNGYCEGDARLF